MASRILKRNKNIKLGKILTIEQASVLQNSKNNKKLVLTGGCFDILHAGHIQFLKKAKAAGDSLIILLESDEKVHKLKGEGRPVNSQNDRASILSNLSFVDYVIKLPYFSNDSDYRLLVKQLEPAIIAITAGNTIYDWEKEYINEAGRKIVEVMNRDKTYSTTKIARKIKA